MQAFTFYSPTEIVFGKGAEEKTAAEIRRFGGRKVLIVYGGGSAVRSGLLARLETQMEAAGLECALYGGVQPNPLLSHARAGVGKAAAFGADFILAVGGGSVIDTAKAIAHGTANPGTDIWDFWLGKETLTKSLPVGAVLTISAAGSETSHSSVLTDEESGLKRGLGSDLNCPKFAIMNPELTYTLPAFQIACGVTDIMMHTLDRYFTSVTGNAFTDEIAEALLRVVAENGRKALKNPGDYDAMSELMWCGSVSHNDLTGLGAPRDFSTHQLGHALSGLFGTAHGASLSAVWGSWASYVMETCPSRFARYGRRVWDIALEDDGQAAAAAIEATVAYFASLGMPTSFSELEQGVVGGETLVELTDLCMYRGGRTSIGVFKKLERGDVYEIYRRANR